MTPLEKGDFLTRIKIFTQSGFHVMFSLSGHDFERIYIPHNEDIKIRIPLLSNVLIKLRGSGVICIIYL